jgi:hypothetical protein
MKTTGILLFLKEEAKWWKDIFYGAWEMTFSKKYAYPYYDGKKKSKLRILLDNMWWTLKYREVNRFYYAYGLDNKDNKAEKYIAYSEFRVLRNILNIRQHENKKNTKYCFNYLCVPRDKFIFSQFCKSLGVPYPKTYGLAHKGRLWWIGLGKDDYEEIEVDTLPNIDAFCKEVSGGGGRKAFFLTIQDGVINIDGNISNVSELKEWFSGARYIIQERIQQHPVISNIYPHSVNTIRLMTIMDRNGVISIYPSKMRFGSGGNKVDNCGQGGLSIGINPETNRFFNFALYNPGFGSICYDKHPDTKVNFSGVEIPYYAEAIKYATKLHKALYGVCSMGWDIAITNDGPIFLEAGEDWEISGTQLVFGGFKNSFYETHGDALNVKVRRVR